MDAPQTLITADCRWAAATALAYDITKEGEPSIPSDSKYYDFVGFAHAPECAVGGEERIDAGYVGVTSDPVTGKEDWVVVSLRGTVPPSEHDPLLWICDWLQDFDAFPTDWIINGTSYGKVESGFAKSIDVLWGTKPAHYPRYGTSIFQSLSHLNADGTLDRVKGIVITGHSKGAAGALLMATLVQAHFPNHHIIVRCFATPLTGDANFKNAYDNTAKLGAVTIRYQNEYDLVPFLPQDPSIRLISTLFRLLSDLGIHIPCWPKSTYGADWYVHDIGTMIYIKTNDIQYPGYRYDLALAQIGKLLLEDTVEDKLLDALKTVAYAHSMVPNTTVSFPTGRYLTSNCGN